MTTAVQFAETCLERDSRTDSSAQPRSHPGSDFGSHPGVATALGLAVVLVMIVGVQYLISADLLPMLAASVAHPALLLALQSAAGMMLPLFIGVGAVSILFIAAVLLASASRVLD